MKRNNLHSVGDKSIFDALCQKNKVKNEDLRELFLKRGILISSKTKREDLASEFSILIHDFDDFSALSDILGTGTRREKKSSFEVESSASRSHFREAAHDLKKMLNDGPDEVFAEVRSKEFGTEIIIKYKSFNPNKNEFSQYITKTATIEIEEINGRSNIRYPSNEDAENWAKKIPDFIKDNEEINYEIKEVSLSSITETKNRTGFFEELMKNMKNFEIEDVTDVFVHNSKHAMTASDDDTEDTIIESDSDHEASSEVEVTETRTGTHITKASLKGEGVLDSRELSDLYRRGFFISNITWHARRKNQPDSDIYVFNAEVSDPENFSGFRFQYKGFYRYKTVGEYTKQIKQPDESDERSVNKEIEEAARVTVNQITSLYEEG